MRSKKLILLLLLAIAFTPYLLTCFYALPFADDFCFGWTASQKISFAQKFLNQYLLWNGRYTSDVLVNLHPLTTGSILLYQLASFVSIIVTPLVLYAFISQWFQSRVHSLITALAASVFYLCYLPNMTEGVYWYIGLVNYHWGSLCFILQLTVFIRLWRNKGNAVFAFILSLFLLVTSVGFNEIAATLIPAYYFGMLIYFVSIDGYPLEKMQRNMLISHFVIAVIASAFVICSPGNFIRGNAFSNHFNFLHSFGFAILQTGRFTFQWLASIPAFGLSLLILINADKIKLKALQKVRWGVWCTLLLFTVFIAAFIPYMATGILGQHRTMNYIFPFWIMLWSFCMVSLSLKYELHAKLKSYLNALAIFIIAVISIASMAISANESDIITDMRWGSFKQYNAEFMNRQEFILKNPGLPVPAIEKIPNSFTIVDIRDNAPWVEKCMKKYYSESGQVLY